MISVVVPCSPIASHPETHILEETLDSVRAHLPDAELIVTFDGVRAEQEHRRQDYEEFQYRAMWLLDHHYKNALPLRFEEHRHQSGMMREALKHIDTELLMYIESDTPLCTDVDIDWDVARTYINQGEVDVIRFHHESVIPAAHGHMMLGRIGHLLGTCQWSQRPHVASTAFYRRIMSTCFSEDANCFIEDKMHSVCHEAYKLDGVKGWNQYRLAIYAKDPENLKRSYHTDGRAGEAKYEAEQVF